MKSRAPVMTPEINPSTLLSSKYADVLRIPETKILMVQSKTEFIPLGNFQKLFNELGEVVQQEGTNKLIFDKRSLRVFDPESMEWYFVEWKEAMFNHGLATHRKIMPQDVPFKYSVDTARDSIFARHPTSAFHRMDIRYVNSVEEAIAQ